VDWSEKPHSWFAAYGPSDPGDTPTIVSCVMFENMGEGVTYAAPVTKKIYEWYVANEAPPSSATDTTATDDTETDDGGGG
jgi:cell division protein FtsI/penicillin-binding protein 2